MSAPGKAFSALSAPPSCSDVASVLLAHRWLQEQGYALKTMRLDAKPNATARIIFGLVWRRRLDRAAVVRHVTLTRPQASELLRSLGGMDAL